MTKKYRCFMPKMDRTIGFQENRLYCSRKLVKIVENCGNGVLSNFGGVKQS
jgi:hypothetical protein